MKASIIVIVENKEITKVMQIWIILSSSIAVFS